MTTHTTLSRGRHQVRIPLLAALLLLGTMVAFVPLPVSLLPGASAVADPVVTQSIADQTLIGSETAVDVRFDNDGDTTAYNLAFSTTLPLGVRVSSSDQAPTRTVTVTDAAGTPTGTVVVWENLVDIVPGSVFHFRYSLQHDVGTGPDEWAVGETINAPVAAYVSDDDGIRPRIVPVTTGSQTTTEPLDFTETGAGPGATLLVPALVSKSEPSPEGELVRGVHDHQTVYTLSLETGSQGGVSVGVVEDWIPAGLEFLGCGTEDNSAAEEYPGSGPLNPGNAPSLGGTPCPTPVSVETVDSGLPAGLPAGVYTHVTWDLGLSGSVPADTTATFAYVAGIPQRENTVTWPGGAPTPASGNQAANLDNNTGAPTTQVGEGTTYTNRATAQAVFQGSTSTLTATESVQAVDLAIHKYVDTPVIEQGAISTWTLQLQTSEYVADGGVADMSVVDRTPDGTCPIGSAHPGCPGTTQPGPSVPYSSSSFDSATGVTTLTWDLPDDAVTGPDIDFELTFSTIALGAYQSSIPVSANDAWTNTADLEADVTTFGPEGPDADPSTFDTFGVLDSSSRDQAGTAVVFTKDVGRPVDGQQCGDGRRVDWSPDLVDETGPGDRVCFRLTAIPPDNLNTQDASLVDFLPPGFRYEPGSSTPGPDNEIPPANVQPAETSGSPETGQRLDWELVDGEVIDPAQTAQIVFSAILDGGVTPDLATSGDAFVNSARFSFRNTNGEVFVSPDTASVGFTEAHLDLVKGITEVDATDDAADQAYPPPGSPEVRNVTGGSVVTYALTITNDGDSDATAVEVRDLLPRNAGAAGEDATCAEIPPGQISNGGTCADGRITWTGLTVPAGQDLVLTYDWQLDATVPVAFDWTNRAGVASYQSSTNAGDAYTYVPRDNIDPDAPTPNTDPADDTARVFTPGITLTKSRTTSVDEAGNGEPDQATIGETITYTVETRQPAGTVATNFTLVDDLTGRGQDLVAASVLAEIGSAPAGGACAYTSTTTTGLTITGDRIELARPASSSPVGDDACVRLTFAAVVEDVPDAGETLNVRPDSVSNVADLAYDIVVDGQTASGSLSADVSTQLVEPSISVDKRPSTTGTVLPGTEVTYQVVVSNVAGAGVSTAHNTVVVDDFSGAQVESVNQPVQGGGIVAGDTITWTVPTLDPGESVTFTYSVVLESPLTAGATLTNTATARTTSLTGSPGPERTAGSPCSPGACPGYIDDDSASLTVGGASLTKSVAKELHTVGDIVTYTVQAVFPTGLDFGPTTITDDLADDTTTFVDTIDVQCTGCTSGDRDGFTSPAPGAADPVWDLGTLGPIDTTRIVTITYQARVRALDTTAAGSTLTNTATLRYGGSQLTDTATIEIAEPVVGLVKRVATDVDPGLRTTTDTTPVTGAIGRTVTYELAVENTGAWTAYDVEVTDEPDTLVTDGCGDAPRLEVEDVSDGAGFEVTDPLLGTDDSCLGFTIPTILPGQTIVISYTLAVPDDFLVGDLITGPELINRAEVPEYFGLVAAERAGNPDVRTYPASVPSDEAHVNLTGGGLGDLVWLDLDRDGTQDAGEPGIPDVGLTVLWFGPDGAQGGGDDRTYTVTTDANGGWHTDDGSTPPTLLPVGTYRITVTTTTLPPGLVPTYDLDGIATPSTALRQLAENEVADDVDFGYVGDQSLGDLVWLDLDRDGTRDAGEPGIPDVDLTVTWAGFDNVLGTSDDVELPTETTAADGSWTASDLPAGLTRVTVVPASLPDGLTATYDLDDGTTAPDGSAVRDVPVGADPTDVDFGYGGTASVGDTVWFDTDGDGSQGAGEPGIAGVDLDLTWWGFDGEFGGGDDITVTQTTDADGTYLVAGIPAGDVRVTVDTATLPGAVVGTYDLDGVGTPDTAVRTVATDEEALDVDFGYTGQYEIGDMVWLDVDGDGDGPRTPGAAGEPGVPGQRLRVVWAGRDDDLSTDADNVVLAAGTPTGTDGGWTVSRVPAGLVRVSLVGGPATTLRVTFDRTGPAPFDGVATATVGGEDLDFDFGLAGTGSLGDTVWLDVDRDGQVDAGEPRIPDVDVQVTWFGFDDTLDTDDDVDFGTATTDARGEYLVEQLPPGRYRATVDAATLPAGLVAVHDLDGGNDSTAVRALTAGEAARDVDFGYAGTGRVGDLVWWDLDGDSVKDPTEPGLPHVTVTLDWAGFDGIPGNADDGRLTQRTDAGGGYLFTGLPAGTHRVTVTRTDLPEGVTATADPDGGGDSVSTLTLGAGAANLDQDFGYVGTSRIGDLVWRDVNRDGTRQDDEPALAGVGITVRYLGPDNTENTADDVVITQVTGNPPVTGVRTRGGAPAAGDPFYLVPGLARGSYVVTLAGATVLAPDAPFSDLDGGDPTLTRLTLTDAPQLDADFAVFRNAAPEFAPEDAAGTTTDCGAVLRLDPVAFVTDANGDALTLVPGSVEAPDGVGVTVNDNGNLRIETSIDRDYTLRWQVSDGRGGVVTVEVPVTVTSSCADVADDGDGNGNGNGDDPDLPSTGSDVTVWMLALALGLLVGGLALVVAGVRRRSTRA